MFSVIIPTFNNIKYLKLCLKSLKKNSKFNHEIIIHINEGSDGTLKFVKDLGLKYSYSKKNEGVCVAFNKAAAKSSKKFLVLGHDDMYFCPLWDLEFEKEIKKLNHTNFFISGTMVQYFNGLIDLDCGKDPESFNENKLLSELPKIKFNDFQGTHWQPSLIAKSTWDSVGGFSNEFSPGLGSDPDFNMKLWNLGIRIFKGINNFKVYHFGSIVLRDKKKQKKKYGSRGSKQFLIKWGVGIKFFKKFFLRSNKKYDGELKDPNKNIDYYFNLFLNKINFFYIKYIYNFNNKNNLNN